MNESFNTIVSLLPLNGVWCLFWSNARIHSFKASNDLFIYAPSILVCFYNWSAWSAALSLPARSINDIFPCGLFFFFNVICNIACDLEESLFVPFWDVTLILVPYSINYMRFCALCIFVSDNPTMFTLFFASYLANSKFFSFSKSYSFPQ